MKTTTHISSLFESLKSIVLLLVVFLFPLFFLPITQEFFITNKVYLLTAGALILITISSVEFLISKRFVWSKGSFDSIVILFVFTVGLSILLSSPNKIQALLNPYLGLASILSLIILYFYMRRSVVPQFGENDNPQMTRAARNKKIMSLLSFSTLIVAIVAIIFFFNPLKNINLPQNLQFLKTNGFNTLGSLLDLALFLGLFVAFQVGKIISRRHLDNSNKTLKEMLPSLFNLVVVGSALILTIYSLVKLSAASLPPYSVSWYAAVEILKNPITALFGIGVDNFSSMFTRAKDIFYNSSSLWQVSSFNVSRSALLHVLTELGIFGVIAFILLLLSLLREATQRTKDNELIWSNLLPVLYIIVVTVLFPPSVAMFFLLFVLLVLADARPNYSQVTEEAHATDVDLSNLLPVYLGIAIVAFLFVGASGYLFGRSYLAEYKFKNSVDAVAKNNLKNLYDNQREAILLNPYIERFRTNFSQTNLLIANNVASKALPQSGGAQQNQLTEQDRQTVTQAIQAAIAEAKAAVALNSTKSGNWENLANIYRNILFVAQGADVWTISSYQRAIILDPQNPLHRINLGGVFFSMKNFDEAIKLFEQASSLKPDWSNAHYNLAWAAFQKGDYPRAVNEMQSVLSLLDPNRDEVDFKKASGELEEFKKKLPKQSTSTESAELQPQQLSLPTPPAATVEPKLQLPKESSPENQ